MTGVLVDRPVPDFQNRATYLTAIPRPGPSMPQLTPR
jgi:hypothetical protein